MPSEGEQPALAAAGGRHPHPQVAGEKTGQDELSTQVAPDWEAHVPAVGQRSHPPRASASSPGGHVEGLSLHRCSPKAD